MRANQRAFSLIELMISLAIIGLLAATAIPAYQNYIARAETANGLATLRPLRTAFEESMARGKATFTLAEAGISANSNPLGTILIGYNPSPSGFSFMLFWFNGNASSLIKGRWIWFYRWGTEGTWHCAYTFNPIFAPKSCPA